MAEISKQENFDLQAHIAKGIEAIVGDAIKSTLKNPKESAFMAKFAIASKAASKIRMKAEENGTHTPGFLIASITSSCNLHCAGCYARGIDSTNDEAPSCQLSGDEWGRIFEEAKDLGISFILLVGGEPLLRRDVIGKAAEQNTILFPIFTNGTYIDEAYLDLFDRNRNLLPVLSVEGNRETTDARRGEGIYDMIEKSMEEFRKRNLLFGASITVTTENLKEVTSPDYVEMLRSKGCRLVLYIEFVPVADEDRHLAPADPEREYMETAVTQLRNRLEDMILLSFPGDELAMGGCMAAGREFFHINSHGGAEPCPFSPFSDINVRTTSLREALDSDLFRRIREDELLMESHAGGCVLYEKREQVRALLQ